MMAQSAVMTASAADSHLAEVLPKNIDGCVRNWPVFAALHQSCRFDSATQVSHNGTARYGIVVFWQNFLIKFGGILR